MNEIEDILQKLNAFATNTIKQVQNNEMEKSKVLKASLLDRAFKGEL